jgi:type I restriction enzyme S subunit
MISARNVNAGKIDFVGARMLSLADFQVENRRTNAARGDVLLTIVGAIGRSAVLDSDDAVVFQRSVCIIRPDASVIESRFLHHVLQSGTVQAEIAGQANGAAQKGIYLGQIEALRVPVPPLEVQRKIVRILDSFTELEAELEAELAARRLQYGHFRLQLLDRAGDSPVRGLGEVATIGTGSHDTKDAVPGGRYVFYARGRETLRLDGYDFDERAIITAGDGAGVGKVFHFAEGKYALHQRAYRIVPHEELDARYLYHHFVSDFDRYLQTISVRGSVTSLRRPMFLNYPIPLPPKQEQERIAAALDKFDALVNDLSIGLPAELAARRKQYEYYRDKLLTFEEAPA